MGLILDATLDSNIIACRLKIYFHYLGRIPKSFLNSLQALRLSLAQYSRTMLRCYLKICHRTPALWSWASELIYAPNTTMASLFLSLPAEDEGMMEGGMVREKEGGRHSLSGLLWHAFFLLFSQQPICFLSATWHQCPIRFCYSWGVCVCARVCYWRDYDWLPYT